MDEIFTQTIQPKSGTIALLSDIPGGNTTPGLSAVLNADARAVMTNGIFQLKYQLNNDYQNFSELLLDQGTAQLSSYSSNNNANAKLIMESGDYSLTRQKGNNISTVFKSRTPTVSSVIYLPAPQISSQNYTIPISVNGIEAGVDGKIETLLVNQFLQPTETLNDLNTRFPNSAPGYIAVGYDGSPTATIFICIAPNTWIKLNSNVVTNP